MDTLQFRATVFMRQAGAAGGEMELMERMFAADGDAVRWCHVMTLAQPRATGRWMVARIKVGRMLALVREQGIQVPEAFPPALTFDDTPAYLAEMPPLIEQAFLESDPMTLLVAV